MTILQARCAASAGVLALGTVVPAFAQDWPHWRGPHFNGSTQAKNLPVEFDRQKNVLWAADLPGPAAGTPIIQGERVFVTSTSPEEGLLLALCFDRKNGALLWRKEIGSGYQPGGAGTKIGLDERTNYASPSPVTDGERVVFFYGNGDLVALDFDGNELWSRNLQEDFGDFCFQWTFSTSPTLWEDHLFLQVLQRDEPVHDRGKQGATSFLLAIDPESGKTIFQHERATPAKVESRESYATPIPHVGADGRKQLLIAGGDIVTAHDPGKGGELWRWGTWNEDHREAWWRLVPSPVVGGEVVLLCAPKRAPAYAVRLAATATASSSENVLAWKSEGRPNNVSSDVPTPLFHQDRFYVLSDVRETLSCVEPADGKIVWSIPLSRDYLWRASPTGADGKLWCMNHHGDVLVVSADDGKVVHQAAMGEEDDDGICSTIAVAHDHLFIRTNRKLYCVGK